MKNEGDIRATNLAGGVMGYIGPSISIMQRNTAGTTLGLYEESSLLIWNAANVTAASSTNDAIVGGVIGAYVTDQTSPIKNLYSGPMTVNGSVYKANGSKAYTGDIVGGLIGYGQLASSGGTDGDGNETKQRVA